MQVFAPKLMNEYVQDGTICPVLVLPVWLLSSQSLQTLPEKLYIYGINLQMLPAPLIMGSGQVFRLFGSDVEIPPQFENDLNSG